MKKAIIIVLTLIVLLVAWRLWVYTGKDFLSGNEISLIDRFNKVYVIRSHFPISLQSISNAEIKAQWKKITNFKHSTLWRARTDHFMAGKFEGRQLQCNGTRMQLENNLLQPEIAPYRWNFHENEILLTAATKEDPNLFHCVLDYGTYPDSKPSSSIHEDLNSGTKIGPGISVLPLQYPMINGTLKRNQQTVPESDWDYVNPPSQLLYQATVRGMFKLFSSADALRSDVYLLSGLANLRVIASADLAGPEMPRVGVRIDQVKMGSFQITTREKSEYALTFPVVSGQHVLELVFENDFFDPVSKADRNVGIHKVELGYQPAVIVQESVSTNDARYTIDYQKSEFQQQEFYANFQSDSKDAQISNGTVAAEEVRRSLLLGAGDEIEFPIIVPRSASLEFGYLLRSQGQSRAKLQIVVHRAWKLPEKLFDRELKYGSDWSNETIDLKRYAGEKIRLGIRNQSDEQSGATVVSFSNPRIVSNNQSPQMVLLFSFDALRADHLSAYGYERKTSPNIDAFAQDGVLYESAFSAATWTLKSFGSVFTSLYPSFNNLRDVDQSLPPVLITLPQLLHQNGYSTSGFIDNPYLHPIYGFSRGFDSYNFHITGVEARISSAVEWLEHSRAEKRFLFVHVISPHSPYTPPAQYVSQLSPGANVDQSFYKRISNRGHCAPVDPSDLKQALLMYDGEIRQIDDLFQTLINKLKEQRVYDNAMIIIMSDHGEEFLDHDSFWHGSNVFTSTSHVPLIIKFPARFEMKGIRVQRPVHLIDILPTILEVAGIRKLSDAQGDSLLGKPANRALFTEGRSDVLGIVNGRYHYMYMNNNSFGIDCSPQKHEQLYDLQADPRELHDLTSERSDLLDFFRQKKQEYENGSKKFRELKALEKGAAVAPDETMKEQMRALGYIH